jgi:hypothetical protein
LNRQRNLAGVIAIGFLLALGLGLSQLPSGESRLEGSALSTDKAGKRALFLLMAELGHSAKVWTDTPSMLPRGPQFLWLSKVPEYPPGLAELVELSSAPAGVQSALDPHDLAHYRRFLEEGGTIFCALSVDGMTEFVQSELGVPVGDSPVRGQSSKQRSKLELGFSGETLNTASVHAFRHEAFEDVRSVEIDAVLRASENDNEEREDSWYPALARIPIGRGALLLAASDAPFSNRNVRKADHGLLASRIVEHYAGREAVLFDEYALGGWTPSSVLSIATSTKLVLFTAHLLLVLALFVWRHAWVGAFSRDPKPVEPLSAVARVKSQATLIESGGRVALLAEQLRNGLLRELFLRAKLRRVASEDDLGGALAELLGPTAAADECGHWSAKLDTKQITSTSHLEDFRADLNEFAGRIQSGRVHASAVKGIM